MGLCYFQIIVFCLHLYLTQNASSFSNGVVFDLQETKSHHATVDVHQARLRTSAMDGCRNREVWEMSPTSTVTETLWVWWWFPPQVFLWVLHQYGCCWPAHTQTGSGRTGGEQRSSCCRARALGKGPHHRKRDQSGTGWEKRHSQKSQGDVRGTAPHSGFTSTWTHNPAV